MLETLDLTQRTRRQRYKERLPELQSRLLQLQRACYEARLATIVVFAGWDAAGRGSTIAKLTARLEPRAMTLHMIRPARTYESRMPWMWRFWQSLPSWGEMAIYHGSWYTEVIASRAQGGFDESEWLRRCRDIRSFELALADDRHVVAKFFLHISREEQGRRLRALAKDPHESWRLEAGDPERHRRYDDYLLATEETLQATEAEWAPWELVSAHDRYWLRLEVFDRLIARLEQGLRRIGAPEVEYESQAQMERARREDLDG